MEQGAPTKDGTAFRAELLSAGLLTATDEPGVYQRSDVFEAITVAVAGLAHRRGSDEHYTMRFLPPVLSRSAFERTQYFQGFPHLVGSVHSFAGDDREYARLRGQVDRGGDWTQGMSATQLVLVPAACHGLYAGLTGTLPAEGRRLEVEAFCFRHEPSTDPARMQSFRMREFVYAGQPLDAIAHRDRWLERALQLLSGLGLSVEAVPANDPFFGRVGQMLSAGQLAAGLKYEIVCPIATPAEPTAIASANYHEDHFGRPFDIRTSDGEIAHSSCFGFGLERITLALIRTHGPDPASWPATVTDQLMLPTGTDRTGCT
jgi:seryl-tRNA synthetase